MSLDIGFETNALLIATIYAGVCILSLCIIVVICNIMVSNQCLMTYNCTLIAQIKKKGIREMEKEKKEQKTNFYPI